MPNRLHMEGWNEKDEFGEYILLHRPGGKNQLRIHWRRRQYNIKMYLKEVGWGHGLD